MNQMAQPELRYMLNILQGRLAGALFNKRVYNTPMWKWSTRIYYITNLMWILETVSPKKNKLFASLLNTATYAEMCECVSVFTQMYTYSKLNNVTVKNTVAVTTLLS